MTAQWNRTGQDALTALAPEPAALLASLAGAEVPGMAELTALARVTCAETLGLEPLPAASPTDSPAAAAFAEQFSLDVSAVTDAQRTALDAELGEGAGEYALAVYAADWVPRVRRALDALFTPGAWEQTAGEAPSLWPTLDALLGAVARLPLLDPVLTELVRLRGARQHNCRMCRSLRSSAALDAGADEAVFDAVDDYEHAGFTDRQTAALALTDALIWQPGHLTAEVLDPVRAHFGPAEAVELVLDIARNAVNKVAVARGTDQANVEGGRQSYTIHADGSIEYGARLA